MILIAPGEMQTITVQEVENFSAKMQLDAIELLRAAIETKVANPCEVLSDYFVEEYGPTTWNCVDYNGYKIYSNKKIILKARIQARITRERDTRFENRDARVEDRTTRLSRNIRDTRALNSNDRVREDRNRITRSSMLDNRDQNNRVRDNNRDTRVENRFNTREQNRNNVNLRDTSRASENLSIRAAESDFSRRNVRQAQRTNERRNIRIMGREILDTSRRFVQRNVDINNNRETAERQEKASDRDRRFGNPDSRVREADVRVGEYYKKNNDISQWSHVLTATFGVLLLAQIITSSNTKKYGISHFLYDIKEKIY
ncbi:hypothetical protein RN001_013051 [Aquatica leii]|uniref:Uncharacterized protein n=1 Tax=Aquatica leii TaxID=1421715 RepID=A0AAN7S6T4_9COLE|nr:hypothetical protein RN001_013051 [Aquatica leii]